MRIEVVCLGLAFLVATGTKIIVLKVFVKMDLNSSCFKRFRSVN